MTWKDITFFGYDRIMLIGNTVLILFLAVIVLNAWIWRTAGATSADGSRFPVVPITPPQYGRYFSFVYGRGNGKAEFARTLLRLTLTVFLLLWIYLAVSFVAGDIMTRAPHVAWDGVPSWNP